MRPKSIVQFEWVYLASMLVGIVSAYLLADRTAAMLQYGGLPVTDATLIFGQWVLSAIFVAIALLASRRGSNVARWIIAVLTALAVVTFLLSIPTLPTVGPIAILGVSQFVLSIIVLYLLFRPDARAWFAGARA